MSLTRLTLRFTREVEIDRYDIYGNTNNKLALISVDGKMVSLEVVFENFSFSENEKLSELKVVYFSTYANPLYSTTDLRQIRYTAYIHFWSVTSNFQKVENLLTLILIKESN